jgi:hypothetical protein
MVSDISRLLRRRVGAGNVLEWCVMTHTCVVSLLTNALFLLLRRREMLHKTKPFRGMNKEMHLKLVCLKGQRPPLERQTVPELAALLRGCWHQDPDRRPCFDEIAERLHRMRQLAVAARDDPRGRRSPSLVAWTCLSRPKGPASDDPSSSPSPSPVVSSAAVDKSAEDDTRQAGGQSSNGEVGKSNQEAAQSSKRRWIFKQQSRSASASSSSSSWF